MSFAEKLRNRVKHLKDIAVKEIMAEDDIAASRLSLCLECPHLIDLTKQCSKCGCFVHAKTKLKNAECPLKKW